MPLDRWLNEYAANAVRHTTLKNYRHMAEQVKRELGGKQISSVTTEDVQRMYRRLREQGRIHPDEAHGAALSASTVRHIHAMLHLAMDTAVREHIIAWNPTVHATPPKAERGEFAAALAEIGYPFADVTDDPAYKYFLKARS